MRHDGADRGVVGIYCDRDFLQQPATMGRSLKKIGEEARSRTDTAFLQNSAGTSNAAPMKQGDKP